MTSEKDLIEARSEANAILSLPADDLAKLFFEQTMHRNLARTVRHLDELVLAGGEDKELGERALSRLGFAVED
ncbi:MAG: hypothetical protein JSS54_11915 [Proteobacteria bacterium]|nr:hypothetical protein [Pseudomonadota bacterium]